MNFLLGGFGNKLLIWSMFVDQWDLVVRASFIFGNLLFHLISVLKLHV